MKGKRKFKPKGDIKCYYCDKVGHIIKNYKKLVEDRNNTHDKKQGETNVVKFDELVLIYDSSHEHDANHSSN